jgi:hypothetical protein
MGTLMHHGLPLPFLVLDVMFSHEKARSNKALQRIFSCGGDPRYSALAARRRLAAPQHRAHEEPELGVSSA